MSNTTIIEEHNHLSFKVCKEYAGMRIDLFLAIKLPMFSRSLFKKLLTHQQVLINQTNLAKPSTTVKEHDIITLLSIPTQTQRLTKTVSNNLGIEIIAQHQDFLIINKPAGLVVHPPQQTFTDTALTDWLVHYFPHTKNVGQPERPGIVHRLDRNTSGIMIIALTQDAYQTFTSMFKKREIQKTYIALVVGHPQKSGTITYPIARHPIQKNIMHYFTNMSENSSARDAQTDYQVLHYFDSYSLVQAKPKTGRTHQIRVHFKAIGHPLLGDTVYGTASKKFPYHALHAQKLEFFYNGASYQFSCDIDSKLQKLIDESKLLTE